MANTRGARKAARQAARHRTLNTAQKSELRTAIKRVRSAIEAGDKGAAQKIFRESMAVIDRIADKQVIHKNKAARDKSRLSARIKAMAA